MRRSVRTTLALVSAAVTSMVAIAFLIPLAVVVRDVARDQAFTSAQLAGAAIEPVLAVTTSRATLERAIASTTAGGAGRLAVYLTAASGGTGASGGTLVSGRQHASAAELRAAVTAARSFIAPVAGGYVVLQPVALGGGQLAVTEVYVPASDVSRGADRHARLRALGASMRARRAAAVWSQDHSCSTQALPFSPIAFAPAGSDRSETRRADRAATSLPPTT